MVETGSQVACELEMLCLVFANGNVRGVVKEYVGGLENWVGE